MNILNLRKKFFIYPKFQATLMGINFLVLGIMFTLISFQVSHVLKKLVQSGEALHLEPSHPYFHFIHAETGMFTSYLAWAFFVCAIVSNIAILLISHRVAGPIVRMSDYFKSISDNKGEVEQPLHFRKGDFFNELPELVNKALQK